jgi:hypothetical protein
MNSDGKNGCNLTGSTVLSVALTSDHPSVATVNPSSATFTSCEDTKTVTVTPVAVGSSTVTLSQTANTTNGTFDLATATFTVNVSAPAPTNTKPTVAVTGFANGDRFEIGSEPTPGCAVTDAEDANPTAVPAIDRSALSHGLGTVTVTCDYTDLGGLAANTATATYTIVDTGKPTIGHTLTPSTPNGDNGWYTVDVGVDFSCDDAGGSGIQSCSGDTTLHEGANQSVTGTATDWAGNTQTDTVSGIDIDETAPTVSLAGGPSDGSTYYFGDTPLPPTCEASDVPDTSGLAGPCQVAEVVTGNLHDGGEVHTFTASATDNAGNEATTDPVSYTLLPWTMKGFYQPVDMSGVWNTVKGGSTVPLKFEIFAGSTEKTNTSAVSSFTVKGIPCSADGTTDDIEFVTTGGTSLRYDSTAGQFVQNWATPKKPGTCYTTTMTSQDGSKISANFMLK